MSLVYARLRIVQESVHITFLRELKTASCVFQIKPFTSDNAVGVEP